MSLQANATWAGGGGGQVPEEKCITKTPTLMALQVGNNAGFFSDSTGDGGTPAAAAACRLHDCCCLTAAQHPAPRARRTTRVSALRNRSSV